MPTRFSRGYMGNIVIDPAKRQARQKQETISPFKKIATDVVASTSKSKFIPTILRLRMLQAAESQSGSSASTEITRLGESSDEVYNKLKPDDPDKVVDIESQDEQIGYEFSTTQIKEFRKVFNAFDRDGNNSIGTDELGPVLNALGYSPSDSDIQKVLSRFDADHSGDLSFEEYLALMAVWVEEDETQIIEAFKVFDKSGDGFVTITELKRALCKFGEKFSEEEADEFFALIDVNKDGIINYEEFVKYMLSEINRGPPPRAVKT